MVLRTFTMATLLSVINVWSYEEQFEIPDETETVTRTCSLAVSLTVIPDETLKKPTGRAKVVIILCDRNGNPYSGETLQLTANAGTFACKLPEEETKDEEGTSADCFATGADGKANLYLLNIPINQRVRIKATYDCGEYIVTSTASCVISRGKAKRRRKQIQVRPR